MDLEKPVSAAEQLGKLLQTARVNQGLSVAGVAQQMHLKQSFIQALESGDYQVIGSVVYVRGYLKIYARILQVDIEPDLAFLPVEHSPTTPRHQPVLTRPPRKNMWRWCRFKKTWILAAVLVLAVVIYSLLATPGVKTVPVNPHSVAVAVEAVKPQAIPVSPSVRNDKVNPK